MRINYDVDDKLVNAWRGMVLQKKGSQRGGAELMAEAMKDFLTKNGVVLEGV